MRTTAKHKNGAIIITFWKYLIFPIARTTYYKIDDDFYKHFGETKITTEQFIKGIY